LDSVKTFRQLLALTLKQLLFKSCRSQAIVCLETEVNEKTEF
jgi:hypothetical protein